MRSIALALGAALFLLPACRTAPTPSTRALSTAGPIDPAERYAAAWSRASKGDAEGALRLLGELDAAGWDIPIDPADFPALASRPELAALASRIAARAPKTALSEVAVELPEKGLVAEGIAADPRDGTLWVGSIARRKIVRVSPAGEASDFASGGPSGPGEFLGMKVDPSRSLLWAVSNRKAGPRAGETARSTLHAFDLTTGVPRAVVAIDESGHLLNDLAVADDGTVFVTDSEAGNLLRLPAGAEKLVPVRSGFQYPNGLAFVDGVLLVCDSRGLWALESAGGALRPLLAPGAFPLGGIDGLSARGLTLVGVQNSLGTARIVRAELSPRARSVVAASVLEAGHPLWRIPTTGTLSGDDFLYIGNSHLDAFRDGEVAPAGRVPTRIHRLKLPS